MGEWDAPHLSNHDHEIMPFIDLCNVACGGHAGSKEIMNSTINLAIDANVEVGAHPGYEDRINFGRKYKTTSPSELTEMLTRQIDLFLEVCDNLQIVPYHIKPHGALYHACNNREMEMNVLVDLMKRKYSYLVLFVFPNSLLHKRASDEKLNLMVESFVDRRYTEDLMLMSRSQDGAVITSEEEAVSQYQSLINGQLEIGNSVYNLVTQTSCIHGDNPNVINILKSINNHG